MKALGRIVTVLLLLPVGGCLVLFGAGLMKGSGEASEGKKAALPLTAALRAHVAAKGGCPASLGELVPGFLAEVPQARTDGNAHAFGYRCVEGRFFLTFPDSSGVFLPSDLFHEYDSSTAAWRLKDYAEGETEVGPTADAGR